MTPSFSRPCLWWSNPNRQAKRPSFLNDRTPRSMFYLPMLNPLSPSFPHKLLSQERSGGELSSYPCENRWMAFSLVNGHPTSIQFYSPTEKSRQSYYQWLARPFFPGLDMLRFLYGSAFSMEVFSLLCSHSCALPALHPKGGFFAKKTHRFACFPLCLVLS